MELSSSSVTATWNLCTIGSVLGCLILLLLFNKNDQILNLWAATTSTSSFDFPITNSSPPPQPQASLVRPNLELSTLSSEPPQASLVSPNLELINTLSSLPPRASLVSPSLEHTTTTTTTLSQPPNNKPNVLNPSSLELTTIPTTLSLSEAPKAGVVPNPLQLSNITTTSKVSSVVAQPSGSSNTTSHAVKAYYTDEKSNNNSINVTYANNIIIEPSPKKKCNIYDGKWVYKPDSKPSYMASQCPFMEEKMSCQRNKRPDMDFEKWSWQPNHCDIPLLNGTDMVEKFKNKRVILVGDSLNRNMWESLSCILYSNIPNASTKAHIHFEGAHSRTFLKAKEEYNFTVEFFWTPYLVEHNKNHSSGKKVLVLDRLSPNNVSWLGADIMIFNSGMHWIQLPPKKGWDLYEYNGQLMDMPLPLAYKRAMNTWARWVQKNVDPNKTFLFFRSVSAEHLDKQRDQWCYGKTKPIMDESYVSSFPQKLIQSVEDVIKGMDESRVKYMNITKLSQYRIDAHPGIYRYNDWRIRAENDLSSLKSTADCGHWCLPGVPDTWNRLLYASLYFDVSL